VVAGSPAGRGGVTEYELVRTVDPAGVQRFCEAMGLVGSADLRVAIEARFVGPGGSRVFEQFLVDSGVASEFWNRIGD